MDFYLWTLVKVLVGIVIVVGYLNLTGRYQIAQMTAVDLVGNFILGGVIGGILYNDKVPFGRYVALLLICIFVMVLINYVARNWNVLRKASIGKPIPIIENGRFIVESFERHRTRLDIDDIATGLRMQGIFGFENIQFAQLEPTGHVSVIQGDKAHPTRFMAYRGELLRHELEGAKFDEEWVCREIAHVGVERLADVFLAEWCYDHMVVIMNDGRILSGAEREGRSVNAQGSIPGNRFTQAVGASWAGSAR